MTIVEAALQKAKDLATQRPGADRRTSDVVRRRPAPPVKGPPPAKAIRGSSLSVDVDTCRQSRVLLTKSQEKADVAAVAAYRILRTRVLHRARAQQWTTIGVTSAVPGDGKTVTAVNLSLSLARENNSSVVLLDLDMRNPSVCKALGVTPPVELREALEGRASYNDVFMSISGIDNLLFAGNVTSRDGASEVLASQALEDLLQFIKAGTSNPLILIDLPPILSTDDALVVAPRIDSMLLVMSEGQTSRVSFEKALLQLSEFPIAGFVLNRSGDHASHYGYGDGAGYGHY